MAAYLSALLVCMKPLNLLLIFAMVALGIVFGAIPGLSATLGIALLLPITFGLSTETSFVMLLAIWIGGVSGTFISAVLIGIPLGVMAAWKPHSRWSKLAGGLTLLSLSASPVLPLPLPPALTAIP